MSINLEDLRTKAQLALEVLRGLMENSEIAREVADSAFDVVEDYILKTPNKFDDRFGLPACKMVRLIIGVPDNDEKQE